MGVILALITVLCWSTATLSFTKATQQYNPVSVNKIRLALAVVLLIIIVFFTNGGNFIDVFEKLETNHFLWFSISGIIGLGIGDYFVLLAFQSIGSTRTALIGCLSPLSAAMGAYILSGQTINWIGIVGISITLLSIIMIIWSQKKNQSNPSLKNNFIKGTFYALISAFCQGLGLAFTNFGLHENETIVVSPFTIAFIRLVSATVIIFTWSYFYKSSKKVDYLPIQFNFNSLKFTVLGTLTGPVIGMSLSVACLNYIPVAEAQTIFASLPIVIVLFNAIIGIEKPSFILILCLFLCISGILLLDWRNDIYREIQFFIQKSDL